MIGADFSHGETDGFEERSVALPIPVIRDDTGYLSRLTEICEGVLACDVSERGISQGTIDEILDIGDFWLDTKRIPKALVPPSVLANGLTKISLRDQKRNGDPLECEGRAVLLQENARLVAEALRDLSLFTEEEVHALLGWTMCYVRRRDLAYA